MKKLVCLLAAVAVAALFPICAAAESETERIADDFGVGELGKALDDDTLKVLDNAGISADEPEGIADVDILALFGQAAAKALADYKAPLTSLAAMVVIAVVAFTARQVSFPVGWGEDIVGVMSAAAAAAAVAIPISSLISESAEVCTSATVFANAFIPVFAAVTAASGFTAIAGTYSALMFALCQALALLADSVFVPMCGMMTALAVCTGLDSTRFDLVGGVKKAVTAGLSAVLAVFGGVLGLQTSLSSATDTLGLRTAKTVVSAAVPVAGGAVADSLSVIAGSVSLVKSAVGAYSALALTLMLLPVVLKLTLWRLAIALGAAVFDALGCMAGAKLVRSLSAVIGIMLAITASFAVAVTVSVLLVLKAGPGA